MSIETYIIDSFTDTKFKGNPAGVCMLTNGLNEFQMQTIAKELGLSETAFVQEEKDQFSIRYFSPKMEIPLCGHATLASAKVIFEKDSSLNEIEFRTIENLKLKITKQGENIVMEFPIYETSPSDAPEKLLEALGLETIKNAVYNAETNVLMLEIEDSQILRNLDPDFVALKRSHDTINGVLVTARSKDSKFDFESRYFWPWSGTNEDPVTGGTHTFLSKYWGERLGKTKMCSFQCSERTGFMELELIDNSKVRIMSQAQIVLKAKLFLK